MLKLNHNRIKILCLLMLVQATQSFGKDFGKVANTFEIKEEGFVAMIQRKLQVADIEQAKKKMTRIAAERIANPRAVSFIKKAEETRTFYFDPTYRLLEDILLPDGQVLHKAGTQINPLDHMQLNRKMFFVDARDAKQVEWLKNELKESKAGDVIENRIILTGGKILEIQQVLKDRVYFDQAGELVARFGIKAVPAIATQEGKMIRITEVNIAKEKGM